EMTFSNGVFDVVTAIEVMEHVSDVDATVSEVHRVLRPGGHFYLTTPNRWFPFETHGPIVRGRRLTPLPVPFATWLRPIHRRLADARAWGRRELIQAVERAPFQLVGHRYMYPPFDRSALRRIRAVTDFLEKTPLAAFGMAHVCVFERL